MPRILNFGSLNIDFVYEVPHFVTAGETLASARLDRFTGGKGLNQSVALARAGAQVWQGGCVGPDGDMLLAALADAGVNLRFVQRADVPTGHAIIQVNPAGQNCILLHRGANGAITPQQVEEALAAFSPGDTLLLQNETNNLPLLMRRAAGRGLQIAFNPSPFGPEIPGYPLELVTLLLLNGVEAAALVGEGPAEEQLAQLCRLLPGAAVLLTLGEAGAFYRKGDQQLYQPAYAVQAVDTTAAGDTFTGYFLATLVQGGPPAGALALAAKAAAIAVTRPGAAPSIPRLDEVLAAQLPLRE